MTSPNNKVQPNQGVNPIVAAVTGAVVAGAVVAGAMIMSDKTNQDKVKQVVADVKSDVNDKKAMVIDKAQKLNVIAKNTVDDVKNI
jgi:hypothetical protein